MQKIKFYHSEKNCRNFNPGSKLALLNEAVRYVPELIVELEETIKVKRQKDHIVEMGTIGDHIAVIEYQSHLIRIPLSNRFFTKDRIELAKKVFHQKTEEVQ